MSTLAPAARAGYERHPHPEPPRRNLVPVAPLREAFERSSVSAEAIAAELGWIRPPDASHRRPRGDDRRLKRALGIYHDSTTSKGKRYVSHRQWIDREVATLLCRALGVDPIDVGL